MNTRLAVACVAAVVLVCSTGTSAGAATGDGDRDVTGVIDDLVTLLTGAPEETEENGENEEPLTFVGSDGKTHAYAPEVVTGRKGELFFGPEFNAACAYGPNYEASVKPIAKIAKAIAKSGRKVVWTLAPAKVTVFPERIRMNRLPHGRCDKRGLKYQADTMRNYDDPNYLPLVDALANSRHQTYYKTDAHWSTVGGAVFAKQLGKRLSPRVAKAQRFRYTTEEWQGMLNSMRDVQQKETAELAKPRYRRVTVTPSARTPWGGWPNFIDDHSWRTTKGPDTYPGKTLLIGDSFSMFGLENLRPLFRNGRWLWYAKVDLDLVIDAIVKSDTVVLELYQSFTKGTSITNPHFLHKLRRALR